MIKNKDYNKCTKCNMLCNWVGSEEYEDNLKKEVIKTIKEPKEETDDKN